MCPQCISEAAMNLAPQAALVGGAVAGVVGGGRLGMWFIKCRGALSHFKTATKFRRPA